MRAHATIAAVAVLATTLALPAALLAAEPKQAEPAPGEAVAAPDVPDATSPSCCSGADSDKADPAPNGEYDAADPKPAPAEPSQVELVQTAGSAAVTIGDYFFSPAALTIGVGDTVTWTNEGTDEDGHTATAEDGSFDSGTLVTGAAFSHTFEAAGTFAYVCSFHPEMEGSITVLADTGGGGNGGGGPGDDSGSGAATTGTDSESAAVQSGAGNGSRLPATGRDELPLALLAAALLATGLGARRVARG